jgi:hypothetical protein
MCKATRNTSIPVLMFDESIEYLNIYTYIILPLTRKYPKFSLIFSFPTEMLHAFLTSPTRATSSAHFFLLDLITLIICGEINKISGILTGVLSPKVSRI